MATISKNKRKTKVLVAMSGGVDSSVAALLLQKAGYQVIGVFMHFWADASIDKSEQANKCCSLASFNDARRVAQKLHIPLYTVNFDLPFKKLVVDPFLASYAMGETPNPCVNCNKFIKFDLLLKKADALGADFIATGHYAKIKLKDGKYGLLRPKDAEKDQTYFLYNLKQKQLKRLLFPLADLTKREVRAMAKEAGLKTAAKPESQEICFIPGRNHNEFLKKYLKLKPGPIKTAAGKTVGQHQGLPLYTIGQRKGVEIGGIGPFYVAARDYKTDTLYVVADGEDRRLFRDGLEAREVNWIAGVPKFPTRARAVIRYRHKPVAATIDKGVGNDILVRFANRQRAVTAGQSVVFYKGDEVLGGGVIME